MSKSGCICEGNWRKIVNSNHHLINRKFVSKGKEYTFYGIIHGWDDYYYGMCGDGGGDLLLSCVGSIKEHGFELV